MDGMSDDDRAEDQCVTPQVCTDEIAKQNDQLYLAPQDRGSGTDESAIKENQLYRLPSNREDGTDEIAKQKNQRYLAPSD